MVLLVIQWQLIFTIYVLVINNGLKLCWILANIPAGAQNNGKTSTHTLPMTYDTYYVCLASMRTGGSNWARTQLLCYFYKLGSLRIEGYCHDGNYEKITAFCLCIGS